MKYCAEFTTSRGINNLVAVPTTPRIDFDYKLPTTKNIRTRNTEDEESDEEYMDDVVLEEIGNDSDDDETTDTAHRN